jgi:hypothetical protein
MDMKVDIEVIRKTLDMIWRSPKARTDDIMVVARGINLYV